VTSEKERRRLSRKQILVLTFAARRQLARWSSKPGLSSRQRAQRADLRRAIGVLQNHAFAGGCELRVRSEDADV
jgi:hypothetical protein